MTTIKQKNTTSAMNDDTKPLFAKDYNVYINHTDAGGIDVIIDVIIFSK